MTKNCTSNCFFGHENGSRADTTQEEIEFEV
jgi:hypothetical protein